MTNCHHSGKTQVNENQMKKFFSLGDSFMTTDSPDNGIISFNELYARRKKFTHVSLARPGATNFCIRLQIDRAIHDCADYVVIGLTSSDRFDIPLTTQDHSVYQLTNIDYRHYKCAAEQHVTSNDVKIISDTFNNLIAKQHTDLLNDSALTALKHYISYLHNPRLQSQKDYYMICNGLERLTKSGIPFVLIPGWMSQHEWSWVDRVWPAAKQSPYDMPYGPSNWETPIRYTATHNPAWAHEEFCQILFDLTLDWH